MSGFLIYVLWVQVFASLVAVIFSFLIGRLRFTPSNQWFTFSAALFLAWIYRVVKLSLLYTDNTFLHTYSRQINLVADMFILPSVSVLIMVFTIQIYKLVKHRD